MYPYGWIKESGTPPLPHWDCILITGNKEGFLPGDEAEIKVIGVYRRADGDHKYVVVESHRPVEDIGELSEDELSELLRLYPNISEGEGWFGKETAKNCMLHDEKAL
ncbi:MAG: hypothetical protein Q4A41_06380 [Bacillota bacterium]|nr:hypothetical protein [Bacillota bacterium]